MMGNGSTRIFHPGCGRRRQEAGPAELRALSSPDVGAGSVSRFHAGYETSGLNRFIPGRQFGTDRPAKPSRDLGARGRRAQFDTRTIYR